MPANRLLHEKSPYLLQHAQNPVDWFPWGEEAFAKARQEQKPILLSIGYSTCHWCHVMAHESFEDQGIADVMNANFISIKVDREERPDVDHIYMTAVTSMTGQGGWPLTVFLTPDAKPFYGGTYFPPYAKWGAPGFMDLLKSVADAWRTNREQVIHSASEITSLLQAHSAGQIAADNIDHQVLKTAARQMLGAVDTQFGGFGKAPKFPMGHNLSFLMRYYKRDNDPAALDAVVKTLMVMSRGGIYDHLGGGFHRYATDQEWHVPHFEKMLYDQALLVLAYSEGYQLTGDLTFARTVKETLDYVLRDMTHPDGGFYSAEDADSEGKEGAFYVWSYDEIAAILGPDMETFSRYYGVKPDGNVKMDPHGEFIKKNILSLVEAIDPQDEPLIAACKTKLFKSRSFRPRPHLDDKILADWNGLMIAAFATAGCVFHEPRYVDAARRAADFILSNYKSPKGLMHRFRDGEVAIKGMLEDYAFMSFGLLQLYEATLDDRYLKEAGQFADQMLDVFANNEQGGFYMTLKGSDLILRPQDVYDGALPSGNSVAALALLKLYYLTAQKSYEVGAIGVFKRFMDIVKQAPHGYAFLLTALDYHVDPPIEIHVYGRPGESTIASLKKVVYKQFIPGKVIKAQSPEGSWSVSVCRKGTCGPKTQDLASLETMIN